LFFYPIYEAFPIFLTHQNNRKARDFIGLNERYRFKKLIERSQSAGLREAGIDYGHGAAWLSGRTVLRQEFQAAVAEMVRP
jgi:hypothetical protein